MNYSYWELKERFTNIDFTIFCSGIVGLNCALELKIEHRWSGIMGGAIVGLIGKELACLLD